MYMLCHTLTLHSDDVISRGRETRQAVRGIDSIDIRVQVRGYGSNITSWNNLTLWRNNICYIFHGNVQNNVTLKVVTFSTIKTLICYQN